MTSAPPLDIENLTCCYGDRVVLDELFLTLNAGEILGLAGAQGAGMSTLIKAILLQVAPRHGRVLIFSEPHELASSRSCLAYLPEEITIPGHLTGYDVVNMTRTVHGEPKAKSSIDDLASALDLPEKRLVHPTHDYTREDSQKLGLIALLSMEKPILLLDQPMIHLSDMAREGLIEQLRAYAGKGGAVLLASHDEGDHAAVADRVLMLDGGRVAEAALPRQLHELTPGRREQLDGASFSAG